jgi:hypothetical protein
MSQYPLAPLATGADQKCEVSNTLVVTVFQMGGRLKKDFWQENRGVRRFINTVVLLAVTIAEALPPSTFPYSPQNGGLLYTAGMMGAAMRNSKVDKRSRGCWDAIIKISRNEPLSTNDGRRGCGGAFDSLTILTSSTDLKPMPFRNSLEKHMEFGRDCCEILAFGGVFSRFQAVFE